MSSFSPAHTTPSPIRIAIIGAGVGGLVLATALRQLDADGKRLAISIYEAQAAPGESGAGIGCFGKSVQVLCTLGLADAMADIATCHPRDFERLTFRVRKADCENGWTFATRKFGKGQTVHRTPFLDLFRKSSHLPSALFHYGKRLVSYSHSQPSPTSEVTLSFADGSKATCDLLVGCDGIRSAVRRCMFQDRVEDKVEATWSGSLAYRALFPMKILPEGHPIAGGPTAYCGQNRNIIAYPVAQGTMVNMVMYVTPDPAKRGTTYAGGAWVADATADEILEHYAGWEEEVQSLLSCFDKSDMPVHLTRWAIHEVPPLESYVRGRVALLGDAAHAMQPHSGSGANQTIEDAYMLAQLLHEASSIDDALRVYDAVRRPYTQAVAASSARAGEMLQSLGTADVDAIRALGAELESFDEWHKEGDVEADVQAALQMLRHENEYQ